MTEEYTQLIESYGNLALDMVLEILAALAILVIGRFVAKKVSGYTQKLLEKSGRVDRTLRPMIVNIVHYTIMIFVLVAVLARFGVETTSIIAVLGAAGLAIGLALQGTLQNISAGFMLLFLRPMKVGEFVDADGISGTVEEIGLFVTHMTTVDGLYISVPNSRLWSAKVTNFSRNSKRRTDLVVGIGYGDDIGKAEKVALAVVNADPRVHKDPAPQVIVTGLGESSVDLTVRYWTDTGNYWPAQSDNRRAIKEAFDKEGISIPFPQRDVHLIPEAKS
ncbi:mechanosensitive ion channel [Kiloniella laminariae]|uniref:Small-conductance mechanosensitive channel n=1 Tax=Kiloniella laminariae TaxID=454162 RepID=A0ABT4LH85_9PROT|nr:mechanosensitive ion channel domain-containing protein [Kiloniella laminariae]MCZ4280465.1 mechanosensitive ion channel [Kiloniella laminariae]